MSRWTNTRPMFRITYVFESEAMDAFVQDFRTLQEANAALAARVRELEEAVGELLGLLDTETWVTVRVNGTGRTTNFDVKPGDKLFASFDRHTGEMVSLEPR